MTKAPKKPEEDNSLAADALRPDIRHGITLAEFFSPRTRDDDRELDSGSLTRVLMTVADRAEKGELAFASRMLAAQAVTLDTIFTTMAHRMALNLGDFPDAAETYARMAMKAQAQSRATLEALGKLHQPREQTVRHVHVNEGGQAIVADEFHHHNKGVRNAKSSEQPHAQSTRGAALSGPNESGNPVSGAGNSRKEKVPNARRKRKRST